MKKRLFLLPLVGGFLLSGCTFNLFGKEITINLPWEKAEQSENEGGQGSGSGSGQGSGSGSGQGSGGSGGQSGGGQAGTGLAKVNLYNFEDCVDKSASPIEYVHGGCKVTISQGSSTSTIASAVTASKTYEFRVYKNFNITFEADTNFSKLEIIYSTYVSNGTSYYFDFEDIPGATNSFDNNYDTEKTQGKATLTLSQATKSLSYEGVGHQTRIASVEFFA